MSALLTLSVCLARSTNCIWKLLSYCFLELHFLSAIGRWCWLWVLEEASTTMEWMHLLHLCPPLRKGSMLLWYQLWKKKVKVHLWSHAYHSPAPAHSAFACVLGTWMPADWLCSISITCQAWLISQAPICSHRGIAVGYVCGTATALLNQRSHLQSSRSNKQQLVKWGPSNSAGSKTATLWPLLHKPGAAVCSWHPQKPRTCSHYWHSEPGEVWHCHTCAGCFFSGQHWKQDTKNCPALPDVLRSVLSTKAWQCRVTLASPAPLHYSATLARTLSHSETGHSIPSYHFRI